MSGCGSVAPRVMQYACASRRQAENTQMVVKVTTTCTHLQYVLGRIQYFSRSSSGISTNRLVHPTLSIAIPYFNKDARHTTSPSMPESCQSGKPDAILHRINKLKEGYNIDCETIMEVVYKLQHRRSGSDS